MTVEKMMFALLRAVICEEKLSDEACKAIDSESLPQLYTLSKHHDLAHLIATALDENELLPKDSEIAKKFQKQQMIAIYRYERINYELSEISMTLEQEKIPFIPLKGSIIRKYYPEPWMRTSCDIDILVHEEHLEQTVHALQEKLHYTVKGERNFHDVSLYSESGVHLELHFNILENMENIDRLLGNVWNYAEPIGKSAYQHHLTNEFFAFHLLAHMSYHFVTGGCGIRPVIDYWLWIHKVDFDHKALREMCRTCHIDIFCNAICNLADVWFAGAVSDGLTDEIQDFILHGGVYGNLENKVAVQQSQKGGKFRYAFSRIFLSYDLLKLQYPVLLKHKWLLPVCEVRRWGKVIFKGRLKHSMKELKMNQQVSKDHVNGAGELLSKLGL